MRIGVPKEIKVEEYRVGLTPASVREYVARGHDVVVEQGAGSGIGASDDTYRAAGAGIADTAAEVFANSDLIVKVKEPRPPNGFGSAKTRSCSPICILRQIPPRPRGCSLPAVPRSHMKQWRTPAAAC